MPKVQLNDTEIFYITTGAGLPCLAMHGGLGFDHTNLYPWLNPLGDLLELTYYDHRGNGRSGRPAKETMTHAQFAADAVALADHLGHEKIAIIGFSYGGFLALEFALRHPERLSHLVLLDTAPQAPSNYGDEISANIERMNPSAEIREVLAETWTTDEEMRERFPIMWPLYFKNYDPAVADKLLENCIMLVNGNAHEGELAAFNAIPRLHEIDVPTLVLAGREDWVCPPSQAQIMHEGIPNSELVIFEDSGHLPYIEEADKFFDVVRTWFKQSSQ